MPETQKPRSSKLLRKYNKGAARAQPAKSISVNRRRITQDDRAKSLNSDDARLVKGMLKRGDIPQHIAQYFGVNNGRISDIKNGNTFEAVSVAEPDELPPSGPYPSIEQLLKLRPEIRDLI